MDRRVFLKDSFRVLAGAAAAAAPVHPANDASAPENRSRNLHRRSIVIVLHDHRPIAPDVPLMRAGGVTAKVYQLGVDVEISAGFLASSGIRQGWMQKTMEKMEEARRSIAADPRNLLLALSAQDIERAKREGKLAIVLGVEGGKLLEGNLENLCHFYRLGLRELQLRWGVPNQLVEAESLTDFGAAVVKECDRLGIVVDLTHIPQKAFDQAIEIGRKPMIVSHGTGKELGERRVQAIARRRGVIGIHFYSSYLGPAPSVAHALDAIDFLVRSGGVETAALGVDFFPSEGAWRDFQRAQGAKEISWAIPDLSHKEEITAGLVSRGYSDRHIQAILGGNILRVFQEVGAPS